ARGAMDLGQPGIYPAGRGDPLRVGPVVDGDQPEIVVLAVIAPAARMVVVLKPVRADDRRRAREAHGSGGRAARPLGLRRDGHQVAVVAVSSTVLVRREEPLRDEDRLAAAQLTQTVEVVARDP